MTSLGGDPRVCSVKESDSFVIGIRFIQKKQPSDPQRRWRQQKGIWLFFSPPQFSPLPPPDPAPAFPRPLLPPPPDPLLPQTERRQENKHMKGIQSIATAEKKNPIKTERSITSVQLLMFKSLRHWDLSFNCTHTGYCRFRI